MLIDQATVLTSLRFSIRYFLSVALMLSAIARGDAQHVPTRLDQTSSAISQSPQDGKEPSSQQSTERQSSQQPSGQQPAGQQQTSQQPAAQQPTSSPQRLTRDDAVRLALAQA